MDQVVIGYGGISYTLDELKGICPKSYTIKEIESNSNLKSELNRRKIQFSKFYNNTEVENFPCEIWKKLSGPKGFEQYSVSNWGRVKFSEEDKETILKQDDENGKYGYLTVPNIPNLIANQSICVYNIVAYAFLGKKIGDNLHVHHIDNNGYNCRPENMILLTNEQHSYVHGFHIF